MVANELSNFARRIIPLHTIQHSSRSRLRKWMKRAKPLWFRGVMGWSARFDDRRRLSIEGDDVCSFIAIWKHIRNKIPIKPLIREGEW